MGSCETTLTQSFCFFFFSPKPSKPPPDIMVKFSRVIWRHLGCKRAFSPLSLLT